MSILCKHTKRTKKNQKEQNANYKKDWTKK